MKLNTIIDRYILWELLPPFLINLAFFTFVFLMAEMLKITDLIVNYAVSLVTIIKLLVFSTPYFLMYIIPMAVMMAVLLTFLRMSGDNEIVALKTGGISLYRLVPSVLLFSLCGCLLTYFMAATGMPQGRHAIKKLTYEVFSSNLDIGLKERTFNDSFKDVMLYVNEIDVKNKTLIDVFIEDKRDADVVSTVIAPTGRLFSEPDRMVFHLQLHEGMINQVRIGSRSAHSISFDTYDLRLDLKKAASIASVHKGIKEMDPSELRNYLKSAPAKDPNYYKALIEFHKKFSIPVACIAMGILAVPLGIQTRSSKRSSGLVLGLTFFLFYYLILSFGLVFGETGLYPPVIGMWMPNIIIGALGIYLLIKAAREEPVRLTALTDRLLRSVLRIGRRRNLTRT
jgi:lipopolysaccharide export system permease protein